MKTRICAIATILLTTAVAGLVPIGAAETSEVNPCDGSLDPRITCGSCVNTCSGEDLFYAWAEYDDGSNHYKVCTPIVLCF